MTVSMTASVTAHLRAIPARRGACPGLSRPLPTGDGLLVRLIPIGTIALDAFAALCAAARRHGNGIVEITARGSIQVRGLSDDSAARFAAEIGRVGIAAEEGVAILCNPLAELAGDEIFDATALAAALRTALAAESLAERLDPKCSVIIDGGGAINLSNLPADIRLRAESLHGKVRLCVAAGGNETSATDLGHVAPECAVETVLRLLNTLARRERSMRARDLIAAQGAGVFHDAIASVLDRSAPQSLHSAANHLYPSAARCQQRNVIGLHALRDGALACGVGLAFGHADAKALEQLAERASKAGARGLRTAPDRALFAIGLGEHDAASLIAAAKQLGFVTQADDPRRYVIACAGAPLCASGHVAARALAPRVAAAAASYLSDRLTVHLSGCAKGCARAAAASLTVVGTAGDCALIADGSARDAPFAAAPVDDLPTAVARYLREHCGVDHA
jgi:precorrin-3B synthase